MHGLKMNGKNQITFNGLEMHQKSILLLKKAKKNILTEKKLGLKVNNNKQMIFSG
jgi:putative heme iron utilization protein